MDREKMLAGVGEECHGQGWLLQSIENYSFNAVKEKVEACKLLKIESCKV
jgi:hypothetical protein